MSKTALIVGAGSGLSGSLAHSLTRDGYRVALVARNTDKLQGLASEIDALCFAADAADPGQMAEVFDQLERQSDSLDVAIYNPSARVAGPIASLDAESVRDCLMISAFRKC